MSTCPVCGTDGCDPCPGPRIMITDLRDGGQVSVLRDIRLVEFGPDLVGYAEQARQAAEARMAAEEKP